MKTNKFVNYWSHFVLNNDSKFNLHTTHKFGRSTLHKYLVKFWREVMSPLAMDITVGIIFKVRLSNNHVKSISYLQKVNKTQYNELLENFNQFINQRVENYAKEEVKEIIFTYHIFTEFKTEDGKSLIVKPSITKPINEPGVLPSSKFSFGGFNLHTTDFSNWGTVFYKTDTQAEVRKNRKTEFLY